MQWLLLRPCAKPGQPPSDFVPRPFKIAACKVALG
jgi:hypothetical protein